MHHQLFSVGMSALARTPPGTQSSPEAPVASLPPLAWGLLVLLFILFIPAFLWVSDALLARSPARSKLTAC